MSSELDIPIVKMSDTAKMPTKTNFEDGGWDFYADEDIVLYPAKLDKDRTLAFLEKQKSVRGDSVSSIGDIVRAFERLDFFPAKIYKVKLGVQICIPTYSVGIMFDRSGLSIIENIVRVAGVIDASYTGELCAGLINLGNEPYTISKGQKIIQMVLFDTPLHVTWKEHLTLPDTKRGSKGFGSSDEKSVAS